MHYRMKKNEASPGSPHPPLLPVVSLRILLSFIRRTYRMYSAMYWNDPSNFTKPATRSSRAHDLHDRGDRRVDIKILSGSSNKSP